MTTTKLGAPTKKALSKITKRWLTRMCEKKEFEQEYLCDWEPDPMWNLALALAAQYHIDCERFDRHVCTGGKTKDGLARPAGGPQMRQLTQNAREQRRLTMLQARRRDVPLDLLEMAIRKFPNIAGTYKNWEHFLEPLNEPSNET